MYCFYVSVSNHGLSTLVLTSSFVHKSVSLAISLAWASLTAAEAPASGPL